MLWSSEVARALSSRIEGVVNEVQLSFYSLGRNFADQLVNYVGDFMGEDFFSLRGSFSIGNLGGYRCTRIFVEGGKPRSAS